MSVDPLPSKVGRGLCASLIAATFALANLGAEAALVPRDIDGDGVPDAYYDTAQNITWLADWNASGQLLTWDQAVASTAAPREAPTAATTSIPEAPSSHACGTSRLATSPSARRAIPTATCKEPGNRA